MALEVILVCLVVINALNVLLVIDLYNRSARLALGIRTMASHLKGLANLLSKVTERNNVAH